MYGNRKADVEVEAKKTLKAITVIKGGKICIWENLGWHYSIDFKLGSYFMSLYDHGGYFSALISDMSHTGSPGMYAKGNYRSPDTAIMASIRVFKKETDRLQEVVNAMRKSLTRKLY